MYAFTSGALCAIAASKISRMRLQRFGVKQAFSGALHWRKRPVRCHTVQNARTFRS